MRFVVILKQIPDDSIKDEYQDVDQLNDSDKNVIKEALDLHLCQEQENMRNTH